jgi:hypothetical protein
MAPIKYSTSDRKKYLIKRIVLTNSITLIIVVFTYFFLIFSLSNLDFFWSIFRKKDLYSEADTIPPTAPYLQQIPEATQNSTIDVTGGTEESAKVLLFIDDIKTQEAVADNNGVFTFSGVEIASGPQKIFVKSEDQNGNQSAPSATYTTQRDNEPPEFEILSPKSNETYRSTEHGYVVKVKTEPEATVLINAQLSLISTDGEASAQIRLERGKNEVKVEVKDKADNKSEKSVFITFDKIET